VIRNIEIKDSNDYYDLGTLLNPNFKKLYNLEETLNDNLSTIIIFEDNNVIKGFLHYQEFSDNIDIINICVNPKFRRKNIASSLLNKIVCKNKKITLEVSTDNKPAISLYEKYGFKSVGIRKGYYNGIDAITMVRF
jgi:[ribosomal protein S18]-alanine N-acetyltransferase